MAAELSEARHTATYLVDAARKAGIETTHEEVRAVCADLGLEPFDLKHGNLYETSAFRAEKVGRLTRL